MDGDYALQAEEGTFKIKAQSRDKTRAQAAVAWMCVVLHLHQSQKGRSLPVYSTGVFLHVTGLSLGTLLPPYCRAETSREQHQRQCCWWLAPLSLECPNWGLFTKQLSYKLCNMFLIINTYRLASEHVYSVSLHHGHIIYIYNHFADLQGLISLYYIYIL